jgi:competence protein ComEA
VPNAVGGAGASRNGAAALVDINQATVADLDRLPGVGPSTAQAIVDHRTRNGPFASVDDLLAVRGIGPAKLAELRALVRV